MHDHKNKKPENFLSHCVHILEPAKNCFLHVDFYLIIGELDFITENFLNGGVVMSSRGVREGGGGGN